MPTIPKPIIEQLTELNILVENNPLFIPLAELARFLHMDTEGLRSCIEHGGCPFGIAWQKNIRGNRAFKIPTTTFYLWYTAGCYMRGLNSIDSGTKNFA